MIVNKAIQPLMRKMAEAGSPAERLGLAAGWQSRIMPPDSVFIKLAAKVGIQAGVIKQAYINKRAMPVGDTLPAPVSAPAGAPMFAPGAFKGVGKGLGAMGLAMALPHLIGLGKDIWHGIAGPPGAGPTMNQFDRPELYGGLSQNVANQYRESMMRDQKANQQLEDLISMSRVQPVRRQWGGAMPSGF